MSRYVIPQPDPVCEVVLGYDPPLQTFFAQVFDRTAPAEADDCLYWIPDLPTTIPTVEALQEALGALVTIPEAICDALRADQRNAQPPTPLQQWALRLFATSYGKD